MYCVGIDLGGTNIAAGLVDLDGNIIYKDSVPTQRQRQYQEIIKDMAMLAKEVIEKSNVPMEKVKSIGVGSPGTPDCKNGIIVYNNNLNFRNVPIREEMQKYLDLPVYVDNDANCAALAESAAGAAKGTKTSVTITLGTGIGSGIIIDGKVYSGFNFAGGEIGHTVIVVDGEQCTCGRKGCWEAYASATALIRQTKRAAVENPESAINKLVDGDLDKIDAKTAFDAAKLGDETGEAVVKQYIKYIAEGVINVINIFMPEVLVIGGGVCKEGDYLLNPLKEMVKAGVYSKEEIPQTQIKTAQLGNDAGIVGAAMLGA
ncbi:MAG TPA: glucokinase [Ruminiclostridium sp.]|uniref:Glucokinase n=1 Tax=Acetivibrio saccincola TaxID=1677857 RepID=A0A2K9E695_9FIRM|nr:ROK family glucokinase [Acetivibrio saccincola]HAA42965.1 glucokinase [Ruminiclostridium sp.]AUG58889.1 Glucokinase [Acetivibrio saccincola]NLW26444.1 ROK family glucokinase [Acetivibrio saccincola]HOA97307.1 ROK family glucokinase [Acetivibrio saccincola]HQD29144.1 ROK family glucokinase [Acetivibrio saccincola]